MELQLGSTISWSVPISLKEERFELWQGYLADVELSTELADNHLHSAGRIAEWSRLSMRKAELNRRPRPLREDIRQAAWISEGGGMGALAQSIQTDVPDNALVLRPQTRQELLLLIQRCRGRETLGENLGITVKSSYQVGVRVLFTGPSGTGKTLASGWLATHLNLPLYRVDLASVTSKYIGETEKNLSKLLAKAEQDEVVLLFDEADALFGKRTEVKDANDRFANAQTNYLLQRIESYKGIVLLTSNSRARFDPAFTRRLDMIVDFPAPGPEERRTLWQVHLGGAHQLSARQLNQLAATCDLCGGHIRNASLTAALKAQVQSRPIRFADIIEGLTDEYKKLSRQMPMAVSIKSQVKRSPAEEKTVVSSPHGPAAETGAWKTAAGLRMLRGQPMNITFANRPKYSKIRRRFAPHPVSRPKQNASGGAGMPLFLQRASTSPTTHQTVHPGRIRSDSPDGTYEQEADHTARDVVQSPGPNNPNLHSNNRRQSRGGNGSHPALTPLNRSSTLGRSIEKRIQANQGDGRPLPSETRLEMENKFGDNFSRVRVHTDSEANEMSQTLGANAFTSGKDIYFGRNKFAPGHRDSDCLIAHELAHVVQQGGQASGHVQFDLRQSLPTALGGFEIDMETRPAPRPGMRGHIRFLPDPSGPYSARIGLIQIANVADVGGRTTTPGAPLDWSRVGTGGEAGRMDLMTTGTDGAPQGWFVDTRTDRLARGTSSEPYYLEPYGESTGDNEYGWLRSPTDVKNASLWDYPSSSIDSDFDFETVSKAADTQSIYGSLEWGFGIRSGVVQNEHVESFDLESATFNEALERFRGYYAHEPIVIYFETALDTPIPGEEAKISGVLDYLSRYPDVMVRIEGYADERGSVALNNALSQQRADNVERIAISLGIDPSRIEYAVGWGETDEFAAGGNAGTWRANRRVVMTFARTASTPINMP